MKIFYDDDIFCRQKVGGISRYFSELIKYQISKSIDVEVLAFLHKNSYLKDVYGGVNFQVSNFKGSFQVCKFINFFKKVQYLRCESKNVYHRTYYSGFGNNFKCATQFSTVHDLIEEIQLSQNGGEYLFEFKGNIFNECERLISVSQHTKDNLCEFYKIDDKKVEVIPLGVDHSIFTPSTSQLTDDEALPNEISDGEYILYVGQRAGYKNFRNLVSAIGLSPKLRNKLMLVAFGGGPFVQEEIELFTSHGLKSNDVLQISGSDTQLATLYRNAACFVFPSSLEGFGIPPLEAMASGCPVAASNAASIPEVVGDAGIYFDPANIDEMIYSIERLVYDLSIRDSMVKRGFKRAKLFSWMQCGSDTLSLYRRYT